MRFVKWLWETIGRVIDFSSILGWIIGPVTAVVLSALIFFRPIRRKVTSWLCQTLGAARSYAKLLLIVAVIAIAAASITIYVKWVPKHWPDTKHSTPIPSPSYDNSADIQTDRSRSEDDGDEEPVERYNRPKDRLVTNKGKNPAQVAIGEFYRRQSAYKTSQRLRPGTEPGFQAQSEDSSTSTLNLSVQYDPHTRRLSCHLVLCSKATTVLIDPVVPKDNTGNWSPGTLHVPKANPAQIYVDSHLHFREDCVFAHLEYSENSRHGRIGLGSTWVMFPLPSNLRPAKVRPSFLLKPEAGITIYEQYYGDSLGVER